MERRELTVAAEAAGCRLDKGLALLAPELSRSQIQTLAEKGSILKNGAAAGKKDTLREGDSIIITLPDPVPTGTQAENIPLEIIYEDDDLLVVNKPKGMVVHPAPGNPSHTLVNALLYHCQGQLSSINGVIRPGIVHRIDKDTSGLLVVAKDDITHEGLTAQFSCHSIDRVYYAVAHGIFKEDEGTVDRPIGRNPADRKKMCITEKNSRRAVTHYTVLERFARFSYIRVQLETGRTHQIRVHMGYIGHPLPADYLYHPEYDCFKRQPLHSLQLEFRHPVTDKSMCLLAPVPEDMCNAF